jgi:hypothetical protein
LGAGERSGRARDGGRADWVDGDGAARRLAAVRLGSEHGIVVVDGKNRRRGIPSSGSGFTVAERGALGMMAALIRLTAVD